MIYMAQCLFCSSLTPSATSNELDEAVSHAQFDLISDFDNAVIDLIDALDKIANHSGLLEHALKFSTESRKEALGLLRSMEAVAV
ncbi:hypothetical protein [Terriglobus sp. RCC_193]|uniref:hypothetical protein n=1 Tax=Terriglobus sp. RCC_193 TaxID=3239218 RepID=UPI003523A1C2